MKEIYNSDKFGRELLGYGMKITEFRKVCEPVVKWLQDNWHPHCSVIITHSNAKMVEDVFGEVFEVKD